ncbi:MAG: hypothetical protein IPH75_07445 [bacterium]|nr:hypothetical protein [bacterium]
MSRLRLIGTGLFAAALLTRLGFYFLTGYTADDAFITFRYAEQIALGNGFVYNIGERVLGTTTPLFTLLLAITTLLRIPVIWGALAISLVASGLTAVVLYKFARALRFTHLAILPAALYIGFPRSIPAEISGMETAFFTLLVISAFYFQHRKLGIYALGMATLASVTRPEGIGLLGLLLAYNLWQDRSSWLRMLFTPVMILGPWLLFSWQYFGSIIPHSVTAKLALYSQFGTMPPTEALVYLLYLSSPFGWITLVLLLIGAWELNRSQNAGQLELTWLVGIFLFFSLSRTHLFHWYITPIYPVFLIFVAAGINYLYGRIRIAPSRSAELGDWIGVAAMVGLMALAFTQVSYYREMQQTTERVHREIGTYLFAQAPPDAIVAAEDIGYIGYYSKRNILDRDGLVSPIAVEYNRTGRYFDLVNDTRPQYLVASIDSPISRFIDDENFLVQYHELRRFSDRTTEYRVYQRR